MKRLIALFATLALLAGTCPARAERAPIPDVLRFSQKELKKEL